MGNAIYRDLIQGSLMVDARFLTLAVPVDYRALPAALPDCSFDGHGSEEKRRLAEHSQWAVKDSNLRPWD